MKKRSVEDRSPAETIHDHLWAFLVKKVKGGEKTSSNLRPTLGVAGKNYFRKIELNRKKNSSKRLNASEDRPSPHLQSIVKIKSLIKP